jgi:complement component 1 Q subcomponent-binding protein
LDEGVQTLFERYLEERGVNTALANFLPDYVEYKEQKEYLQWLQNVKSFVSA